MNEVTIFTDITTEQALLAIEEESSKYTDLYVEMDVPEQRKFVKGKAAEIGDILKRLDRARIDKSKDFKQRAEREAEAIRFRLEQANKPFTLLIDEYNAERKKVLDAENSRKKAIEDQAAIDSDYEIAVLMMDKYFSDKDRAEKERIAYEENLKREAVKQAEEDAKQAAINAEARRLADIEAVKQAEIDRQQKAIDDAKAEKARLAANQEHVAAVHRNMKAVYIAAGFPDDLAEVAVKLLVKNKVPNTTFNY